MENETANKALDVIVAITDERDSWQARALAAEVALESLAEHNDEVAVSRARAEELAEELFHSIKALLLAGGA